MNKALDHEVIISKSGVIDEFSIRANREKAHEMFETFWERHNQHFTVMTKEDAWDAYWYIFQQGRSSIIQHDWGHHIEVKVTIERTPTDETDYVASPIANIAAIRSVLNN